MIEKDKTKARAISIFSFVPVAVFAKASVFVFAPVELSAEELSTVLLSGSLALFKDVFSSVLLFDPKDVSEEGVKVSSV
jgi:hypothetical protein